MRFASFALLLFGCLAIYAQDASTLSTAPPLVQWQTANLQYLYGWNWNLGPRQRDVVSFEYANSWRYGDNFFFLDVSNFASASKDASVFGEWHPRLSLSKLTGRKLQNRFVKDVLTAHEIGFGERYASFSNGLSVALNLPRFDFANISVLAHDNRNEPGRTCQVILDWNVRFGKSGWSYGGYVDAAGHEGGTTANVISDTQLLYDIGRHLGRPGMLQAGTELKYWHNEFGIRGVDEFVPQAMLKWSF